MSNSNTKTYKVDADDLEKVIAFGRLVTALLAKVMADDELDNTKLPDTKPATTLERAVDDKAEAELDRMEARAQRCHCHRISAARHAVATCPKPKKPRKPLPKTMKEIAQATGVAYKKIHKYAYVHGIGTATRDASGHQQRVFTDSEVREILRHFGK